MGAPRFLLLRGETAFRRFDHDGTTIDVTTESVRLATVQQAHNEPPLAAGVLDAWLARRGGAAVFTCPPEDCRGSAVLVVERSGSLQVDRGRGLEPWPSAAPKPAPSAGVRFGPAAPAPAPHLDDPTALAADPYGRLWLLERGAARILLLAADDLRVLDVVRFPVGAALDHLACSAAGVLAIDSNGPALFFQPYGGEWRPVPFDGPAPPVGAVPIAAAGLGDRLAALYRLDTPEKDAGGRDVSAFIALVEGGRARRVDVPGLEAPLPFLVLPGGDLLLGEIAGPLGSRMIFTRFIVTPDGLRTRATLGARGFDGRAFFLDASGEPLVTTASGLRPLFAVLGASNSASGRIESYALDSERYGCVWHRVFLEACLPQGTAMEIEARTSDDLPPEGLRRDVNPPFEGPAQPPDDRLPLGSRTPSDEEGWMRVGTLDRRAAWADVAFPPAAPEGIESLEGLIKNPPGRYLWLRVHLLGTKRLSPALSAVRATYPRPSLLDHLPAFWRADPHAARSMDHVLSLFEGFLTELDLRIDALPRLLDPSVCPPESLDWLGSFISLTLDPRLSEDTRRTLVREGVALFKQRGTVPGLKRLCTILAGADVDIVEGFRQRRSSASFLGEEYGEATGAILGPGFQLGGDANVAATPTDGWELELATKHDALLAARAAARTKAPHVPLCPPDDPPPPLDPDPLVAFCRKLAHRFTVVVFRCRDAELEDILRIAVERNKPAHTVHEICWLEAGFRLGVTTYVGFGTRLGDVDSFESAIVGQSPLGAPTLLSAASRSRVLATFVGSARIGVSTHLQ